MFPVKIPLRRSRLPASSASDPFSHSVTLSPPDRLAALRAWSARRTSSRAPSVSPSPESKAARPTLNPSRSAPLRKDASDRRWRIFCATALPLARDWSDSKQAKMAPPYFASWSELRSTERSLSAISRIVLSPASRPNLSLMTAKSSGLMNSNTSPRPSSRDRAIAWFRRIWNSARPGSFVMGSSRTAETWRVCSARSARSRSSRGNQRAVSSGSPLARPPSSARSAGPAWKRIPTQTSDEGSPGDPSLSRRVGRADACLL
jgi:hypothetical protein